MAGTITFGGIGSGIDTEAIVTGLVKASSEQLNALKGRASDTHSAVSSLSDIASLLGRLKSSADALADVRSASAYTAAVNGTGVVATATGVALPGTFSVEVQSLAKEHRSYSDSFTAAATDALAQTGTIKFGVGTGTPASIAVTAADSLQTIADKINAAGLRVSASIFNDGTTNRLQIRGMDTGAASAVSITETGTALGLSKVANRFQAAGDSRVLIDGFTVTRPTNQIVGAIQGVTLAVTAETTSPAVVTVASDPASLGTKVKSVVDNFNAIVTKVHTLAGFGSTKGTSAVLSGDSTLRNITSSLSSAMQTNVGGTSKYQTLGSIGVSLTRDGTLSLDQGKLGAAMADDAAGVARVLAGDDKAGSGAMDIMSKLMSSLTQTGTGILTVKQTSLDTRAKSLDQSSTRENDRLTKYADDLRKQFTAMDSTVAGNNSSLSYLTKLYG
jgi:flagellar hook-associated protein 2